MLAERAAALLHRLGLSARTAAVGDCGWEAWTNGEETRARREAIAWFEALADAETVVIPSPTCVYWATQICPQLLDDVATRHAPTDTIRRRLWEWHTLVASLTSPLTMSATVDGTVVVFPGCHAWRLPNTIKAVHTVLQHANLERVCTVGPDGCCGANEAMVRVLPELATALQQRVVYAILRHDPSAVVVPEPRCQAQVRAGLRALGMDIPVLHTVELFTGQN